MKSNKIYSYLALTGEIVVLIAATLWIMNISWVGYLFALGATMFAIGRFHEDYNAMNAPKASITIKRLYRQRTLGTAMLLFASITMNLPQGFYFGIYLTRSVWVIPFTVFVILEVYTAFRIPNAEKEEKS